MKKSAFLADFPLVYDIILAQKRCAFLTKIKIFSLYQEKYKIFFCIQKIY